MTTRSRRSALVAALPLMLAAALPFGGASAADLKSYNSSKPSFWAHPPADWFLGDETEAQKGLAPPVGPATPTSADELQGDLKKIKLPPGFKIELYASGIPEARQMAWGANGTLFVGSFNATNVYAVTNQGGQRTVKTILKGLNMPTGVAFRDGALYVIAINKLLRYDNAEANLDKMPEPVVVYDDMPPYVAHGWKYLVTDKNGWVYIPFGPPFNIGIPPTSVSQIRHVDLKTGLAEIVALGVRNSVGGDIDPRSGDYWFTENARDWVSDDLPSDKLNHITRLGEDFGYPHCHQGNLPDPKFAMGHKCSEFTPPVVNLGAARGAAWDEILYRQPVPGAVQGQYLHRRTRLLEPAHVSGRPHRAGRRRSRRQARQAGSFRERLDHRPAGLFRPAGRYSAGAGRIAAGVGRLGRCDLSHQLRQVGLSLS